MASLRGGGRTPPAEYAGFERAVYVVGAGQFVNVFGSGVVYPFAALYFVETVDRPFSLVGAGLLTLQGRLTPAENGVASG